VLEKKKLTQGIRKEGGLGCVKNPIQFKKNQKQHEKNWCARGVDDCGSKGKNVAVKKAAPKVV